MGFKPEPSAGVPAPHAPAKGERVSAEDKGCSSILVDGASVMVRFCSRPPRLGSESLCLESYHNKGVDRCQGGLLTLQAEQAGAAATFDAVS